MNRPLLILVAFVGLILTVPGLLIIPEVLFGSKPRDLEVALSPLAQIQLNEIEKNRVTELILVVPDTPQWRRIRANWGTPVFIISAAPSGGGSVYCLPELGINVDVMRRGTRIPLRESWPPYGMGADCVASCLSFQASLGDELLLTATKSSGPRLPAGELVVVSYWPNTKDHLVGDSIERQLAPYAAAAGFIGIILIGLAVIALIRRQKQQ